VSDLKSLSDSLTKLVEYAGVLAQRLRPNIQMNFKEDGSIVTNADIEVENWLKPQLMKLVPETEVWGEEGGYHEPGLNGIWLVDPIDGTSNYAHGLPLWGVSVALYQNEKIVLSEVVLPDLSESYSATLGGGAFLNRKPLPFIPAGSIKPHELVSYSDNFLGYASNINLPGKMRSMGAFVIDGTFVACGRFRGLINKGVRIYDIAACIGIARELDADVRYTNGDLFIEKDVLVDKKINQPLMIFPKESGFMLPLKCDEEIS